MSSIFVLSGVSNTWAISFNVFSIVLGIFLFCSFQMSYHRSLSTQAGDQNHNQHLATALNPCILLLI